MGNRVVFQKVSKSEVGVHPKGKGVVQFYGGQFFGNVPFASYEYLIEQVYAAGFSVIVTPFQFGTNHLKIAASLLVERDTIRERIPEFMGKKHFWLGHSLGCKFIAMLEAYTDGKDNAFKVDIMDEDLRLFMSQQAPNGLKGIVDEPSILMAPVFADDSDLIPFKPITMAIEALGLGIKPTRMQVRDLVEKDDLFNLCAILTFKEDGISGNREANPKHLDSPWLIDLLTRQSKKFLTEEIDGGHLTPTGNEVLGRVIGINLINNLFPEFTFRRPPLKVDEVVVKLLESF